MCIAKQEVSKSLASARVKIRELEFKGLKDKLRLKTGSTGGGQDSGKLEWKCHHVSFFFFFNLAKEFRVEMSVQKSN